MADVVNTTVTAFVIKERTGDERTLTLRTRALPYRPLELSGTQRNSVEWYPGSPIGTLQVYGAKEEPTTISGQWKDMFLYSPLLEHAPATVTSSASENTEFGEALSISERGVQTARELVNLVDDMRRKGQEVEVTWLDQARRGIIDRFTVRWFTGHDCEWEIMFTWISQGESLKDVALLDSGATGLSDLPNKVQEKLDAINADEAAFLVPQAGSTFDDAVGDLRDVGANIQMFADQLTDSIISVAGDVTSHNEALRRVAGILDGIKLEADLLAEIAEETADGMALDTGAISSINATLRSFGEVLATRAKIRDRAVAATELRNLAAREQATLVKKITSEIVSVFQARENQDLREISQRFYGTPDEWRSLMVFNNLTSSGLAAGQIIFVPASPTAGELC